MSGILKSGLKLLSPQFYKATYAEIVTSTRALMHAGSAVPLFKAMALVGVVGYSMEYYMVGRHHAAERQKVIKEALKNAHH